MARRESEPDADLPETRAASTLPETLTRARRDGESPSTAATWAAPSEDALISGEMRVSDIFGSERFEERYDAGELLGRGGMGEVRLYLDRRIGREVAVKVIRDSGSGSFPASVVRFLREARVQGRLEHPSIVPVYDLGTAKTGDAFFTMKRLRGTTLHDVLRRLRAGDPETTKQYSRRKLLTAFNQVCLTVDYAHQHGVVHRDLKPANIMFGDFGEVYVLDWGLAKLDGAPDLPAESEADAIDPATLPEHVQATRQGDMLGTPGYMAPEQVRGERDRMDARSDVYALGAILFEILTLEPLHGEEGVAMKVASTVLGAEVSATERAPDRDIAPELDAICRRATALAQERRHQGARELSEAIEAYLDGVRDVEMRRERAAEHAAEARAAADRALSVPDADEAEAQRKRAMQEVGKALAFAPEDRGALSTLVRLLKEPPRVPPKAIGAQLGEMAQERTRWAMGVSRFIFLGWLAPVVYLAWAGIRDWATLGAAGVLIFAASGSAHVASKSRPLGLAPQYAMVITSMAALALATRLFGPLMFVPAVATVATLSVAMTDRSRERFWWTVFGCASFTVPMALEWAGVIPASYAVRDGALIIHQQLFRFDADTLTPFLTITYIVMTALPAFAYGGMLRNRLTESERRALTQTWHLEQLLPSEAVGETA